MGPPGNRHLTNEDSERPLLRSDALRIDRALLAATGCADLKRAQRNLELLAGGPLTREAFLGLLPNLLQALPNSPDPDMALNNLERFAGAAIPRAFLFSLLAQHRNVLDLLLAVLGASRFLSDLLIRQPTLLAWLLEPGVLRCARRRDEFRADLNAMTGRLSQRERKWSAQRRFALRLGYQRQGPGAGEQFVEDFTRHTTRVRELHEATLGGA